LRATLAATKTTSASTPAGTTENEGADSILIPTTVDQLAWMGLSAQTIVQLRPYITMLPDRTPVNINTAPALVLFACIPKASMADAQRLTSTRTLLHFNTLADANKLLSNKDAPLTDGLHSVGSRYFEVRGQLRLGELVVQERSLVQRDGQRLKVLWRERGVLPPQASLQ
jgi:general secretion pathway protein K